MHEDLKAYIDDVVDFPSKGVTFRDISPLLSKKFPETIQAMAGLISAQELEDIEAFAGVDSRGFIFAAALAVLCNKQFIMPRKGGKLPQPYAEKNYDLEYGSAKLQLKHGTGNIIIVDDVLATGGTMKAAAELAEDAGYSVKGFITLIDLKFLNDFSWKNMRAKSVIQYEAA